MACTLTWLGHGTTLWRAANGKTLIVDPWLVKNPACPDAFKNPAALPGIDLMLVTHGHFDHIDDAVAVAKAHKPAVGCIFEIGVWLESKGVGGVSAMNKGGTQTIAGFSVTMTTANHSCGILDDGKIIYGGEACGYVVQIPDGPRVYLAGDTNVFSDMALIGELYKPDVACIPIGDHFTMGPVEAAKAIELVGAKTIVPLHFATFPLLKGTREALEERCAGLGVRVIHTNPGERVNL
jgi:L-ascorbate metabolism protein UlaG (beta-lactamase superfamily)